MLKKKLLDFFFLILGATIVLQLKATWTHKQLTDFYCSAQGMVCDLCREEKVSCDHNLLSSVDPMLAAFSFIIEVLQFKDKEITAEKVIFTEQ